MTVSAQIDSILLNNPLDGAIEALRQKYRSSLYLTAKSLLNYPDINWKDNVDNIYHFDMEESVVNMTGLEMFAITGHFPKRTNNFKRQNSFTSEFVGNNGITYYYYVFANPPYGGDKNTKTAEDIKRDKLLLAQNIDVNSNLLTFQADEPSVYFELYQ